MVVWFRVVMVEKVRSEDLRERGSKYIVVDILNVREGVGEVVRIVVIISNCWFILVVYLGLLMRNVVMFCCMIFFNSD